MPTLRRRRARRTCARPWLPATFAFVLLGFGFLSNAYLRCLHRESARESAAPMPTTAVADGLPPPPSRSSLRRPAPPPVPNATATAAATDVGAAALRQLSRAAAREAVVPAAAEVEAWLRQCPPAQATAAARSRDGARGPRAWWRAPFAAQCGAAAPHASAFVCRLGCSATEPELEHSLAATGVAGTARYGARTLAALCKEQKPVVVILRSIFVD